MKEKVAVLYASEGYACRHFWNFDTPSTYRLQGDLKSGRDYMQTLPLLIKARLIPNGWICFRNQLKIMHYIGVKHLNGDASNHNFQIEFMSC
jgi:hypothetical protein